MKLPRSTAALATALFLVFFAPIILLSEWFPLDMGGMFEIGELFQQKLSWIVSPYNGSGRYFPIYWLFNSLLYSLFGAHVLWHFLVQSLILFGAFWLTCICLRLLAPRAGALATGGLMLLLFFNTPLAENATTLGKAEPLAYLLVIGVIYLFAQMRSSLSRPSAIQYGVIGLLFLTALLTKETSLALLGFAACGASMAWILKRLGQPTEAKPYLMLLGALISGWVCSKIPYLVFYDPKDQPTYLQYSVNQDLIRQNFDFYQQQQPDVLGFGIAAMLLLCICIFRTWRLRKLQTQSPAMWNALVMACSLFAMGAAYYLVLIAWRWPMAYYMLLPSVLFRLIVVYGLVQLGSWHLANPLRVLAMLAMLPAIIYGIAYNFYISSAQITYSRAYKEGIMRYMAERKPDSTLVMDDYPFYAEQVTGTHLLLKVALDKSISVNGIGDLFQSNEKSQEVQRLLGISDERVEANRKNLPKRDDFILSIIGSKPASWFLRGVTPYHNLNSQFASSESVKTELVSQHTWPIPSLYPSIWTGEFNWNTTWLGYELHRVVSDKPGFFWYGRHPDNWVGREAMVLLTDAYDQNPVLRISAPPFTLPNKVKVLKNGKEFRTIVLANTDEVTLPLEPAIGPDVMYTLEVERTATPISVGLGQDTRALGILAYVTPATPSKQESK